MLEAQSLTLSYGGRDAVRDVSFAIRPGEMVALVGPNGSGKSTLLRGLARIQKPSSGRVLLGEQDIRRMPTRDVARVLAMLPQSPESPRDLTVEDLVWRGRYPHQRMLLGATREDRQAVDAAMHAAGVVELAHRPLRSLSGGERQRAWIALALAQQPRVLLLDEPTASLDLRHQTEIMGLLRRMNREEGVTVVVVLHDLVLAARYSDRILALRDGRLEFDGPARTVFTPDALERVFGVPMTVLSHPETGDPVVLPRATVAAL